MINSNDDYGYRGLLQNVGLTMHFSKDRLFQKSLGRIFHSIMDDFSNYVKFETLCSREKETGSLSSIEACGLLASKLYDVEYELRGSDKRRARVAEDFRTTIFVTGFCISLVAREMISQQKDLHYWETLSDTSVMSIYISHFNSKIFRKIISLIPSNNEKNSRYIEDSRNRDSIWTTGSDLMRRQSIYDHRLRLKVTFHRLAKIFDQLHIVSTLLKSIHAKLDIPTALSKDDDGESKKADTFVLETETCLQNCSKELLSVVQTIVQIVSEKRSDASEQIMKKLGEVEGITGKNQIIWKYLSSLSRNKQYPLDIISGDDRRPSYWEKMWFKYFIGLTVGCIVGSKIYPIIKDGTLKRFALSTRDSLNDAWTMHVKQPMQEFLSEVFKPFREQRDAIVTKSDLDNSREALSRMLVEFAKTSQGKAVLGKAILIMQGSNENDKVGNKTEQSSETSTSGSPDPDDLLEGLMIVYESELQKPISNFLFGQLFTSILIQAQKMKVVIEAAMLQMDQILASNKLTVAAAAAMPGITILTGGAYVLLTRVRPKQASKTYSNLPLRLALSDVERHLLRVCRMIANNSNSNNINESSHALNTPMSTPRLHIPRGSGSNSLFGEEYQDLDMQKASKLSITRGYTRYLLYQLKRKLYSYFDRSISGNSIFSKYKLDNVHNRIVAANYFTSLYELIFGVFHDDIKLKEFKSILKDIHELEVLGDGISNNSYNIQEKMMVSGSEIHATVMRLRTTYQCFNRWA